MTNITLDTDELGIWLINETPEGPQQMGMVSWAEVARGCADCTTAREVPDCTGRHR